MQVCTARGLRSNSSFVDLSNKEVDYSRFLLRNRSDAFTELSLFYFLLCTMRSSAFTSKLLQNALSYLKATIDTLPKHNCIESVHTRNIASCVIACIRESVLLCTPGRFLLIRCTAARLLLTLPLLNGLAHRAPTGQSAVEAAYYPLHHGPHNTYISDGGGGA